MPPEKVYLSTVLPQPGTAHFLILQPAQNQRILGTFATCPSDRSKRFAWPRMSPQQPLRGSCNACHKSKTKCTYTETGICNRCTYMEIECVRAPSQRKGKPKGAKNHRSSGTDAATRYGKNKALPTPPRSRTNSSSPQATSVQEEMSSFSLHSSPAGEMNVDSLNLLNFDNSLSNPMNMDFQNMSIDYGHIPSLPSADALETFFGSFDDALQDNHLSKSHQQDTHGVQDHDPKYTTSLPGPTTVALAAEANIAFPDALLFSPSLAGSKASSSFPTPTVGGSQQQFNDHTTCSCFNDITRKLEKLQHDSGHRLPFDVALTRNKETLATVCHTLRCNTSHDSTVVILLLALLRKVLFSYRETYQMRFSWNNNESGGKKALTHSDEQSMSTFRLGSYTLDKSDETSLKQQILLLDLKKVPRLLSRMEARANSSKDEHEVDSLAVYQTLRELLSAEFQKTLDAMT